MKCQPNGDVMHLRTARMRKRLSQAALAQLVGCDQTLISRLERVPKVTTSHRMHFELCRVLSVAPSKLTYGTEA